MPRKSRRRTRRSRRVSGTKRIRGTRRVNRVRRFRISRGGGFFTTLTDKANSLTSQGVLGSVGTRISDIKGSVDNRISDIKGSVGNVRTLAQDKASRAYNAVTNAASSAATLGLKELGDAMN